MQRHAPVRASPGGKPKRACILRHKCSSIFSFAPAFLKKYFSGGRGSDWQPEKSIYPTRAFLYVFLTFEKSFNPSAYGKKALISRWKGAEGLVFLILQHGSAELCDYMETHGTHCKACCWKYKAWAWRFNPCFPKTERRTGCWNMLKDLIFKSFSLF